MAYVGKMSLLSKLRNEKMLFSIFSLPTKISYSIQSDNIFCELQIFASYNIFIKLEFFNMLSYDATLHVIARNYIFLWHFDSRTFLKKALMLEAAFFLEVD